MTSQTESILSLPKRPKMSQAMILEKTHPFSTNYYSLSYLSSNVIYQYDITFDPPLPEDSRAIFKGCITSATK
jgi:hypothetical protein